MLSFRVQILLYLLRVCWGIRERIPDYCELSCQDLNYVCIRRKERCAPSKLCGHRTPNKTGFTQEERDDILDMHNRLRQRVAEGIPQFDNSKAGDMMVLSYSRELEFTAQCIANKCTGTRALCVVTPKHPKLRQLVNAGHDMSEIFNKWASTGRMATLNMIKRYVRVVMAGQVPFVQLIWAKTTRVGCGRTVGDQEFEELTFFVCIYSIRGAIHNEPIFTISNNSCDECGGYACNAKYHGLCGIVRDDPFEPPFQMAGVARLSTRIIPSLALLCHWSLYNT